MRTQVQILAGYLSLSFFLAGWWSKNEVFLIEDTVIFCTFNPHTLHLPGCNVSEIVGAAIFGFDEVAIGSSCVVELCVACGDHGVKVGMCLEEECIRG